jgi:hypothetical protein
MLKGALDLRPIAILEEILRRHPEMDPGVRRTLERSGTGERSTARSERSSSVNSRCQDSLGFLTSPTWAIWVSWSPVRPSIIGFITSGWRSRAGSTCASCSAARALWHWRRASRMRSAQAHSGTTFPINALAPSDGRVTLLRCLDSLTSAHAVTYVRIAFALYGSLDVKRKNVPQAGEWRKTATASTERHFSLAFSRIVRGSGRIFRFVFPLYVTRLRAERYGSKRCALGVGACSISG